MIAIFKRELKSYFYSPIGYVFIGFFMLVSGWIFSTQNLLYGTGELSYLFQNLTIVFLLLIPILTMRLLSEEKNNKTDQLLFTSPLSTTSIVTGKILSALCVFAIALVITLIYPLLISRYTTPAWSEIISIYIGFFLMGAAFISIGVYISSHTENQIISAVATFAILFVLYLADNILPSSENEYVQIVISWLSINQRYSDFAMGFVNLASVVYYLSIIGLFGFLTVHQLEKQRWSK